MSYDDPDLLELVAAAVAVAVVVWLMVAAGGVLS